MLNQSGQVSSVPVERPDSNSMKDLLVLDLQRFSWGGGTGERLEVVAA